MTHDIRDEMIVTVQKSVNAFAQLCFASGLGGSRLSNNTAVVSTITFAHVKVPYAIKGERELINLLK
jgi:hypothetical protein